MLKRSRRQECFNSSDSAYHSSVSHQPCLPDTNTSCLDSLEACGATTGNKNLVALIVTYIAQCQLTRPDLSSRVCSASSPRRRLPKRKEAVQTRALPRTMSELPPSKVLLPKHHLRRALPPFLITDLPLRPLRQTLCHSRHRRLASDARAQQLNRPKPAQWRLCPSRLPRQHTLCQGHDPQAACYRPAKLCLRSLQVTRTI